MSAPEATMKAVVYDKPFEVAIRQVEKPLIQHPDDIIVRVTTTCICGSDLHMYEGRTSAEPGTIFGHENLGIVDQVGSGVTLLKRGDRVVMPFNVACGRCMNCEEGKSAFCTYVNPGFVSAASRKRYAAMGPYSGGQAEYLRVPFADFNALILPSGTDHEEDFVLLADIFPTGWQGVDLSGFRPGESIAIFGAGPVGLMSAYSAVLRGASEVYVVDRVYERLNKVKEIGCIPIDFSKANAVDQILQLRGGKEVDRGVDAVGYQAKKGDGKTEQPNAVLEALIQVVRPTGGIGVPGVYVPSDPGAADPAAAKGYIYFPFGKLFEKGLTLGAGQCNVKLYNRYLRDLIISGRAKPSFVVSHNLPLSEAPGAYEKFDKRVDGYTKVLLHP
ncbi:GroES-like protein [Pleurotus eryngii]|uniref:GroES-like protein n=1 Tax=Pleurotus eryngii TaxID=5323 RepID=A0A9P6D3R0_PLEER|nr:GroES-like protein [Pleurotus eryngii]